MTPTFNFNFASYVDICACFSVPPSKAVILDEKGSVVNGVIGPFNELSTLILTCDVIGGEDRIVLESDVICGENVLLYFLWREWMQENKL
jgi:hypothetical protein